MNVQQILRFGNRMVNICAFSAQTCFFPDRFLEKTWYGLGRMGFEIFSSLMFNKNVVYKMPIPAGAKILVANHPTTIDPVMMTTLVLEPVKILISETLFKVPLLGPSLKLSGHIRVVHSDGKIALAEGVRSLKDGRTVGIFPEGAISPSHGGLNHGHTGAARMALSTGVPVIPVGIALDTNHIQRVETIVDGKKEIGTWYFHGSYTLIVGEPLVFSGSPEDREAVRFATELIMQNISVLSAESATLLRATEYQPIPLQKWLQVLQLN
jgi:1-acyl-sn-glycerol-3-phosphate acyltransferase